MNITYRHFKKGSFGDKQQQHHKDCLATLEILKKLSILPADIIVDIDQIHDATIGEYAGITVTDNNSMEPLPFKYFKVSDIIDCKLEIAEAIDKLIARCKTNLVFIEETLSNIP